MDSIELAVLKAVNSIELKCLELLKEGRITRAQSDRRIKTAIEVAEYLLDRKFKERRGHEKNQGQENEATASKAFERRA